MLIDHSDLDPPHRSEPCVRDRVAKDCPLEAWATSHPHTPRPLPRQPHRQRWMCQPLPEGHGRGHVETSPHGTSSVCLQDRDDHGSCPSPTPRRTMYGSRPNAGAVPELRRPGCLHRLLPSSSRKGVVLDRRPPVTGGPLSTAAQAPRTPLCSRMGTAPSAPPGAVTSHDQS